MASEGVWLFWLAIFAAAGWLAKSVLSPRSIKKLSYETRSMRGVFLPDAVNGGGGLMLGKTNDAAAKQKTKRGMQGVPALVIFASLAVILVGALWYIGAAVQEQTRSTVISSLGANTTATFNQTLLNVGTAQTTATGFLPVVWIALFGGLALIAMFSLGPMIFGWMGQGGSGGRVV